MFTMQRGARRHARPGRCASSRSTATPTRSRRSAPPSLVATATLTATGQLPKFADDAFAIERDDLWCIPTAEVPLTSIYAGEVLDATELPMRLMAYSAVLPARGRLGRPRHARHAARPRVRQGRDPRRRHARAGARRCSTRWSARAEAHDRRARAAVPHHRDLHRRHGPEPPPQLRHRGLRAGCRRVARGRSISWFSDYQARRADIRYRPSTPTASREGHRRSPTRSTARRSPCRGCGRRSSRTTATPTARSRSPRRCARTCAASSGSSRLEVMRRDRHGSEVRR